MPEKQREQAERMAYDIKARMQGLTAHGLTHVLSFHELEVLDEKLVDAYRKAGQ